MFMEYKKIIAQIAKRHGVSSKQVDSELKTALEMSGINVTPDIFIQIAAERIKKTIYHK